MENKAIGFERKINLENIQYEERSIPIPELDVHDVLIKVRAASVNPVDVKMQESYQGNDFRVLGFDAVGEIVARGAAVDDFAIGDRVYYSGQQQRPGANQRYQAVNHQLIAKVPQKLTIAETAALPLTAITANEILTDSFGLTVSPNSARGKSILILNGAGGVGSILIQLAKMIGLRVIATASRPETAAWVKQMGADLVLNHRENLDQQLAAFHIDKVEYIAILHSTNHYWEFCLKHIAPFGKIASIVETTGPVDLGPLKNIGAQFSWNFMFAKGNYGVRMAEQGEFLAKLASYIDEGKIKTTLQKTYHGFSLEALEKASSDVARGNMIGKVVVEFD